MPSRLLAAALLLVLLTAAAAWWWLAHVPTAAAAVQVQPAPLIRTLEFSARVATASRVDVGSTLTGRVAEVALHEGARVQAGDWLLRLQDDELRAALAQAQAAERQASARLAGLRSTGREVLQASVSQAESVWQAAQAELARTEALVERGFLGLARLDEARRAAAVARAQLDSARAQLAAGIDHGSEWLQAEAALALARSGAAMAAARLAETVISAPADATVLVRSVEPGQIVQPGRVLMTLALAAPVELVAQVDERHLQQLQPGQSARVVADAFPDRAFDARVRSIAPVVDPQRGVIEVKFDLPAGVPDFLREDMTLSVSVETGRREQALVVPAAALRDADDGTPVVWVAREGRVQARPVRTGLRTLEAVEVIEGLAPADLVLVGPSPTPGERVRPDTTRAARETAAGTDAASALSGAMGR